MFPIFSVSLLLLEQPQPSDTSSVDLQCNDPRLQDKEKHNEGKTFRNTEIDKNKNKKISVEKEAQW